MAKRETNAQRAAREDERRTTWLVAGALAMIICKKGRVPMAVEGVIRRIKKFKGKVIATWDVEDLLVKKPESERLRETYTLLGREFCEFKGNVSEFLRLVADQIEGKPAYSPGQDWYDGAITRAYEGACRSRAYRDAVRLWLIKHRGAEGLPTLSPSFSEFEKVFWEQNPKLQGVSDRSLRRSLRRLGYIVRPDKRGRPKGK
jgi:hypothetical protein